MTSAETGRFTDSQIDDIRRRTDLPQLVGQATALKRKGRDWWGICPFCGGGSRTPPFHVRPDGFFKCFNCDEAGDCFSWIMKRHGVGFIDAVRDLGERAGILARADGTRLPPAAPVAAVRTAADIARDDREKIAYARLLFAESGPVAGTPAEEYLASRGLKGPWPPSLRFHAGLRHTDTGRVAPAMIAAVQDRNRSVTGAHRTFLLGRRPDGGFVKDKKMAGLCWTGAVRLCAAGPVLGIAEGIETALAVRQATGMPVWAALSRGNFAAFDPPPIVSEIVICADHDEADPDRAAQVLAKARSFHESHGRLCRIIRAPAGMDFNDVLLQASGSEAAGRGNQASCSEAAGRGNQASCSEAAGRKEPA